MRKTAHARTDPADIINLAIHALIRHGFELPALVALRRLEGTAHSNINATQWRDVCSHLDAAQQAVLETLLVVDPKTQKSPFARLCANPGRPTRKNLTRPVGKIRVRTCHITPRCHALVKSHRYLSCFCIEIRLKTSISADPTESQSMLELKRIVPQAASNIGICRCGRFFTNLTDGPSMLDAPFRCPNCRRPYSNTAASFEHRVPLLPRQRAAIFRTFIG